eukprot:1160552-Pelagomonas_calceolata.AAC.5
MRPHAVKGQRAYLTWTARSRSSRSWSCPEIPLGGGTGVEQGAQGSRLLHRARAGGMGKGELAEVSEDEDVSEDTTDEAMEEGDEKKQRASAREPHKCRSLQ